MKIELIVSLLGVLRSVQGIGNVVLTFGHASLESVLVSGYWQWHVTIWACQFRIHVNFRVLGMACYCLGMPVQNPRQFQGIGNGMLPFGHASLKSMTISY